MPLSEYGPAAVARGYNTYEERLKRDRSKDRSRFMRGVVLPVAAVGGAAAAPFLFGGAAGAAPMGATASAPAAPAGAGFWGGVTAPTFGAPSAAGIVGPALNTVASGAGKFTLGNLLKFAELGVPAVTNLLGQRSQNRALDRQAALEQQALAEQMAFARDQEAFRRAENERMTAEDQRRWETEERNRQRELAATEEERAYTRRLMDERETRRAPYRQASRDALFRLQDILGIGRSS